MRDAFIELTRVEKFYGEIHALKGINLRVKRGSIFAYLGPNGAGKTTTVRILLQLLKPSSGKVAVNADRRKIGFILENEDLSYRMSTRDYLRFFSELYGVSANNVAHVVELLELNPLLKTPLNQLSKGTKKRVALARALLCSPEMLFLDEPLEGFDPEWQVKFIDILKGIAEKGSTIFITSHQLLYMEKFATNFGIIYQGKLLGQWKMDEVDDLEKFYLEVVKNA